MAQKSKDVLNSLAKTAADNYLKHKKSMNDTLKKTASSEGLEPHQVEYVAAEANKMVWASHYQKDKKAAYDFPLADPKQIVSGLQTAPTEKVASANVDFMLPPSSIQKQASDGVVQGVFESDIMKGTDRRALKQQLSSRYEKLAQAKENAGGEIIMARHAVEVLETKFVKEARELIMQTPFTERVAAMDKIAEFVRSATSVERGQSVMAKLASKVAKDGLVKQADMRAPEEYISRNSPARIVNGNHVLYITLETIAKKDHYLTNMCRDYKIVDDTLPVLREKIRGL